MLHRPIIFLTAVFMFFSSVTGYAQQSELSPEEMKQYKNQAERLLLYLQDTFNFLGDPEQPVSEKEIVINESYSKIFVDDKVQIEDDLDENRIATYYKDVQAYLKDIMFFYKSVNFSFEITSIEPFKTDDNKIYFKITFNRHLQGVGVNNDTVDNNQIRYMEVNLNLAEKSLKIASIYTTKLNEKDNIRLWWNSMSDSWRKYFGRSILVYDTLPLASIKAFTDSTIVVDIWKQKFVKDTTGKVGTADSLSLRKNGADSTIVNNDSVLLVEVPDTISTDTISADTISADTYILYNLIGRLKKGKRIDISNNLLINNLFPLSGMPELIEVDISNTLINDLEPLHNLGKISVLNVSETPVSDLSDLKFLWNLREINFSNTLINSISVFSGLPDLESVNGNNTKVSSIYPLNSHKFLENLQLANCKISSIDSIEGLTGLKILDLHSNPIAKVDSIVKLVNLRQLNLDSTSVSDLKPLSKLPELNILQINDTKVSDLTPLAGLKNLKIVYCDNSGIDLAKANEFNRLNPGCLVIFNSERLENWWNTLPPHWKDVFMPYLGNEQTPTKEKLHKLLHISELNLSGNSNIRSLKPLKMLYKLEKLNISSTKVSSLEPLKDLSQLSVIHFNNTKVVDVSPLRNLHNLKEVSFSTTKVSDISALVSSRNLKTVYCDNTGVNEEEAAKLIDALPDCLVVFETTKLTFWWNNLSDVWQNIFTEKEGFEANPETEQLHSLVEKDSLYLENLPIEAELDVLNPFFRLKTLYIENSQLTTLSALADLTNLETLHISNSPVADITGLEKLHNLKKLTLKNTAIDDIYNLSELNGLKYLDISGTRVSNLKPLRRLANLEVVFIDNTRVKNLKHINNLPKLKLLKCYNTPVRLKKVNEFKNSHPQVEVVFY